MPLLSSSQAFPKSGFYEIPMPYSEQTAAQVGPAPGRKPSKALSVIIPDSKYRFREIVLLSNIIAYIVISHIHIISSSLSLSHSSTPVASAASMAFLVK